MQKAKIIIALVMQSLITGVLAAESITISLNAEITQVDQYAYEQVFGGQVTAGDTLEGWYTYDSLTLDGSDLGDVGQYVHRTSGYGIYLSVGEFVFRTNPENVDFLIAVGNNHIYSTWDNYGVTSFNNLPLHEGLNITYIGWGLQDPSGLALSSDALPSVPPVLEDWSYNRLIIEGGADETCSGVLLEATVTSVELVPEPASAVIMGIGAVLLAMRRKGR